MIYAGAVVASALLLGAAPGPPSERFERFQRVEPPTSCVVPVHSGLPACPPEGRQERELPRSCVVPVTGGHALPGDPLVPCPTPPLFPKGRTVPVAPGIGR